MTSVLYAPDIVLEVFQGGWVITWALGMRVAPEPVFLPARRRLSAQFILQHSSQTTSVSVYLPSVFTDLPSLSTKCPAIRGQ